MQTLMNEQGCSEPVEINTDQEFKLKLKLKEEENQGEDDEYTEEYPDEDEDCDEFSFSVAFDGLDTAQISAEEVFSNGQIKPIFPFFYHDLLTAEDLESLKMNDGLSNVKKVFVETEETEDRDDVRDLQAMPSTSGDDEVVGPFCEWRGKAVEVCPVPKGCKKSNSTGFSKIWRFRGLVHRSNSDGRDAFVFLNHAPPSGSTKVTTKSGKKDEKVVASVPEKKGNGGEGRVNGHAGGGQKKVKKVGTGKAERLSAHEVYMRSKLRDEDRRRSYLPYRPELVGFFTNVTGGGLSRSVNPF